MQMTSWPFWLMIVSIAMAVLPVWRSPMISSRWPRPIGTIASMALRPVCSGSLTGERSTTPGAMRSMGANCFVTIGPLPSIGWPSEFTTRPTSSSPTGTEMMRPGALDRVAFLDGVVLAEEHAADAVLFEVQRDAEHAVRELEHLAGHRLVDAVDARDAVAHRDDACPTSETSTSTAWLPIWSRMILVISSALMFMARLILVRSQKSVARSQ